MHLCKTSISCTPRGQICKSCTPDAAGLIICARQNWSVHANHARKFSVHAEDLPENVHTFQTGGGDGFMVLMTSVRGAEREGR